ncbi:MAG TPA: FAD-binding oxidoreductase [Solirubrobacteraceae bacterium]
MTPATTLAARPSVAEALDALTALVEGDVVQPGQDGWDDARQAWNLAVDQRPAAVVLPECAEDVLATVQAARAAGLRVAPQGTGHNAGPLGDLSDTILLTTSRMRGVEIDPVAKVARVEAGALWADVVAPAAEYGLAALSGSSHDVGVVGYTLGGGASWLVRKYGPAARYVQAVEIVTADGELIRADAENHADLLWAVRGGGGSFGVVTALEFGLFEITEVFAGALFFPYERSEEVLTAWARWTKDMPNEMTSVGRMLQVPPIPELPEFLRGQSFAVIEAIYCGDPAEGERLVAPLRELGPAVDTIATIPVEGLLQLHMDPPEPVPGKGGGALLADVDDDAIRALVATAGPGSHSPLLGVEIRHMGGAAAEPHPELGAMVSIPEPYAMFAVGMAIPEIVEAVEHHVSLVQTAVEPWSTGRGYLNFVEEPTDAATLFERQAYARLREVKARYDASDVVRSNHPVAPAR